MVVETAKRPLREGDAEKAQNSGWQSELAVHYDAIKKVKSQRLMHSLSLQL